MGTHCLMVTEFLFGRWKNFGKRWWWLHNILNVNKATEMDFKMAEMADFTEYLFHISSQLKKNKLLGSKFKLLLQSLSQDSNWFHRWWTRSHASPRYTLCPQVSFAWCGSGLDMIWYDIWYDMTWHNTIYYLKY